MNSLMWLLLIGVVLAALAVLVPSGTRKAERFVNVLLILAFVVLGTYIAASWIPLLR